MGIAIENNYELFHQAGRDFDYLAKQMITKKPWNKFFVICLGFYQRRNDIT